MKKSIKYECGSVAKSGDKVSSSYGIPPTRIEGNIFEQDGVLYVSIIGNHTPKLTTLKNFKKCLVIIYKEQS